MASLNFSFSLLSFSFLRYLSARGANITSYRSLLLSEYIVYTDTFLSAVPVHSVKSLSQIKKTTILFSLLLFFIKFIRS